MLPGQPNIIATSPDSGHVRSWKFAGDEIGCRIIYFYYLSARSDRENELGKNIRRAEYGRD